MALENILKRLKQNEQQKSESDWENYKLDWINSIKDLQNTIINRWFEDYNEKKLMEFSTINSKRVEPYIGEYLTTSLEITLANNKTFLLEPIAGITADYDGKLEFSMLGNIQKRVSILRVLAENKKWSWIIATSFDPKDQKELTKAELEKLIETWLF